MSSSLTCEINNIFIFIDSGFCFNEGGVDVIFRIFNWVIEKNNIRLFD